MSRLARSNRVLFLESLGLRQPRLAGRDLRRMARRVQRAAAGPRAVDGLHVLSPLVIPIHGRRRIRALNARLLRAQVGRAARALGFERPVLWSYVPQADWLRRDARAVARSSTTAWTTSPPRRAWRRRPSAESEARFAARADLVLASAPALAERMRTLNDRVFYAPNVADTDALRHRARGRPDRSRRWRRCPRPRIVFTGAVVATKLDLELLEGVARARPGWSIALVGPVGAGRPAHRHLGDRAAAQRPPARRPPLRRAARGAARRRRRARPYAINDLTRSVFPMKVYEYLAAGLPVVTTPLPALDRDRRRGRRRRRRRPPSPPWSAPWPRTAPRRAGRARRPCASNSWDARLEEIGSYLSGLGRA